MRVPIVAGNWKMNLIREEAAALVEEIRAEVEFFENVDILVCPSFTCLETVVGTCEGTSIKVGAQNMHWDAGGAYTGEISPPMLKDIGCEYVVIGHSERRYKFFESDEIINKKVKSALEYGIIPILCIGETLEEREEGITDKVCTRQIKKAFEGLEDYDLSQIVLAYEPVWAIGTGRSASPRDAEHVINYIRKLLTDRLGEKAAAQVRIQYGGSVKPENAEELMGQANVDGALVGGASLKAASFVQILRAAEAAG